MSKYYTVEFADVLKKTLDALGWKYNFLDEYTGMIEYELKIDEKTESWSSCACIYNNGYDFFARCQYQFNEQSQNRVAEYLHRVNAWTDITFFTKFAMHYEDSYFDEGIYCFNSLFCPDNVPSKLMISTYLNDMKDFIKVYGEGLSHVIKTNETPNEIFKKVRENEKRGCKHEINKNFKTIG